MILIFLNDIIYLATLVDKDRYLPEHDPNVVGSVSWLSNDGETGHRRSSARRLSGSKSAPRPPSWPRRLPPSGPPGPPGRRPRGHVLLAARGRGRIPTLGRIPTVRSAQPGRRPPMSRTNRAPRTEQPERPAGNRKPLSVRMSEAHEPGLADEAYYCLWGNRPVSSWSRDEATFIGERLTGQLHQLLNLPTEAAGARLVYWSASFRATTNRQPTRGVIYTLGGFARAKSAKALCRWLRRQGFMEPHADENPVSILCCWPSELVDKMHSCSEAETQRHLHNLSRPSQ